MENQTENTPDQDSPMSIMDMLMIAEQEATQLYGQAISFIRHQMGTELPDYSTMAIAESPKDGSAIKMLIEYTGPNKNRIRGDRNDIDRWDKVDLAGCAIKSAFGEYLKQQNESIAQGKSDNLIEAMAMDLSDSIVNGLDDIEGTLMGMSDDLNESDASVQTEIKYSEEDKAKYIPEFYRALVVELIQKDAKLMGLFGGTVAWQQAQESFL